MLSKNKRTHYILIRQGDKNDISKFPITRAQYDLYEEELSMKKHNDFFKIQDIDTNQVVFNGRANKIEWFEEIKIDPSIAGARWVCDFWRRHSISQQSCDCSKEFDCLWIVFKSRLEEMGYKVPNNKSITEEMRAEYKKKYK